MKKIIKKFLEENGYREDAKKVEHVLKSFWTMYGLQNENDVETLKNYIKDGKLKIVPWIPHNL